MPHRPTRFNHVVGLDLKFVRESQGTQYAFLHVRDLATLFNLSSRCEPIEPAFVAICFKAHWATRAEIPEARVVDKGSGFGAANLIVTSDTGIFHSVIHVESPWHHGMVERHGQVLSDIVQANIYETNVSGK